MSPLSPQLKDCSGHCVSSFRWNGIQISQELENNPGRCLACFLKYFFLLVFFFLAMEAEHVVV